MESEAKKAAVVIKKEAKKAAAETKKEVTKAKKEGIAAARAKKAKERSAF